jgi:hypothetical protein
MIYLVRNKCDTEATKAFAHQIVNFCQDVKKAVLIQDNHGCNKTLEVKAVFASAGLATLFLPP